MRDLADHPEAALSRRSVLMGGALVALSATTLARTPQVVARPLALEELEKLVPKTVGNWKFETRSGLIVPPADPSVNELYNEVLTRVYSAATLPPIMLLIAYSNRQDGMLQLHRPEVCYPASGLRIVEDGNVDIAVGTGRAIAGRRMTAKGGTRSEQLLYWTRVGSRHPRTWLEQRIAVARENLAGTIPDGVLVRISLLDPSWKRAEPALREFALSLGTGLSGKAGSLIVG